MDNKLNDILDINEGATSRDGINEQPSNNDLFHEKALRIIANVILIGGVLFALTLFFVIGLDRSSHFGNTSYYFNLNGFLISILILVGSIVSWAFLHVICNISEGINRLSKHAKFGVDK